MTNVDLVRLAGSRGRLSERTDRRPGDRRGRSAAGWRPSASRWPTYVSRTATTPILNQSNERNATILDAQGRLAALSVGIPQFMLTSTLPVRFALDFLGVDEFREGDVFVANDPYHGGGHLPDYNVFAPVFADDPRTGGRRMVLIASIQCHHGDTGGGVPGGYNVTATDIWGEGVRWPVVKVIDRGVERRDVLLRAAGQQPHPRATSATCAPQIGAAQLAAHGSARSSTRYGTATVEESVDFMIDYAARRFREEVTAWPDGVYEADAYVDHDPLGNPDVHLHVKITVEDDAPHDRLHGQRHPPRDPGVVDVRQHPRVHRRPDRVDDGSGDPEERGLLRPDQARRAAGLRAEPAAGQAGERGHAPPRRRRRRGHRGRDAARAARQGRAPDLQDRHPHDHRRRRPGHRRRPSPTTPPRSTRAGATRQGHGRLGRAERELRQPVEGDRRDQREPVPARAVEPRLPHRLRRPRSVAGHLRLALREGSARRRQGVHVRRRHEVPDARHLRRRGRARRTR